MRLAGTVALLVPGCSILLGFDDPLPDAAPAADAGTCGDRIVQADEQCDDGLNLEDGGCPHCRFAVCGDGSVRAGVEECDPAIAGSPCTPDCLICGAGTSQLVRPSNQHCYLRFDNAVVYDTAVAECHARRAYLVTISDEAENTDVQVSLGGFASAMWIGMTDRAKEAAFAWETEEPFAYTNWSVGAPDNGGPLGENCGSMDQDATWNDLACDTVIGYICEQHPWRVLAATGHAYLFLPGQLTWDDARASCQGLGGDLAAITDAAESAFIASFVEGTLWIGADDRAAEGTFVWESGEPWSYTQWNADEPNDVLMMENCVALVADAGATWIDTPCETPHAALCELAP